MIISHSRKFVYIHIEKTGGTSVEESLLPYVSEDDIIFGGTTLGHQRQQDMWKKYGYRYHEKTDKWYSHSDANRIKEYLENDWNTYYKFATVRDPVEIMISYYYYIEKTCLQYAKQNLKKIILDVEREGIEFTLNGDTGITDDIRFFCYISSYLDKTYVDGFISKMLEFNKKDVHPQWTKVDNSVELYDLSTITENWPRIIKKIGLPEDVVLLHLNKSKRETVVLKEETINLIRNHFKLDYEKIPSITGVSWI